MVLSHGSVPPVIPYAEPAVSFCPGRRSGLFPPWEGLVLDGTIQDPDTVGVRALNLKLRYDTRVSISTIPLSDGLTLARKR
jgi:hypothetical protein